jgi:chromate transporter
MVVQFVGFMAAFAAPGGVDPLAGGILGGLLVTWVTFVPSFTFIFAGAPYAEYLRRRPQPAAALSGVTAAVVGVIANLAAWFALQTLFATTGELRFGPLRLHTVDLGTIDLFAVGLAVASYLALARLRWPLLLTIGLSGLVGLVYFVAFVGPR